MGRGRARRRPGSQETCRAGLSGRSPSRERLGIAPCSNPTIVPGFSVTGLVAVPLEGMPSGKGVGLPSGTSRAPLRRRIALVPFASGSPVVLRLARGRVLPARDLQPPRDNPHRPAARRARASSRRWNAGVAGLGNGGAAGAAGRPERARGRAGRRCLMVAGMPLQIKPPAEGDLE